MPIVDYIICKVSKRYIFGLLLLSLLFKYNFQLLNQIFLYYKTYTVGTKLLI